MIPDRILGRYREERHEIVPLLGFFFSCFPPFFMIFLHTREPGARRGGGGRVERGKELCKLWLLLEVLEVSGVWLCMSALEQELEERGEWKMSESGEERREASRRSC